MVVRTKSDKAEEGRRAVLEFLLANHPLDCPVCDQSGECDLQNFYLNFGSYDPRFREQKVKKKKAVTIGLHVMLDQERCILCSRCAVHRRDHENRSSVFSTAAIGPSWGCIPRSGSTIPTRAMSLTSARLALTEADFRFKARVWHSRARRPCATGARRDATSTSITSSIGHISMTRAGSAPEAQHNPDVNQWWMCDEGRFGFH